MHTDRRTFLKTAGIIGAGSLVNFSQAAELLEKETPFEVPALGYSFDALEPYIDAQTMQLHHDKHHQAYVDKLNDAIQKEPQLKGKTLDELIANTSSLPESVKMTIRNNGGGHWNHSFFWKLLKKDTKPSAHVTSMIARDFGSMENMMTAFEKAALGQFGSGWAWVVSNNGKLTITSTPNQDNPLMDIASIKGKPVIGIDVWEHAYYLKYQNKRADYVKAFWNVLNWDQAEKNLMG